jgi:hypothetical protein
VKDDPLSSRPDDEIHRLARGVIGLLPLGSLLTEMFTRIVVDPAQQRRDRIIREILEKIANLEETRRISSDRLASRPDFAASFFRGITAVDREVEPEKLALIRNAIVNTAIDEELEPSIRAMLFGVLERVTTAHIGIMHAIEELDKGSGAREHRLMRVLSHRIRRFKTAEECKVPQKTLDKNYPYYDGRDVELRAAIINDLRGMGLVNQRLDVPPDIYAWSTEDPAHNDRELISLTLLGLSFLHFINEPPAPNAS